MDDFLAGVAQHYPGFEPRTVVADELPYTMASGRALLDIARARHPDSDLLLFSSDLLAAGALLACLRQGIAVPQALAVMGLGDYEVASELNPGLTTIAVPTVRMARKRHASWYDACATSRPTRAPSIWASNWSRAVSMGMLV